jgi:hypothetical protein
MFHLCIESEGAYLMKDLSYLIRSMREGQSRPSDIRQLSPAVYLAHNQRCHGARLTQMIFTSASLIYLVYLALS